MAGWLADVGLTFDEVMEGTFEREGERFDRPFRFDFRVEVPRVLDLLGSAVARCEGTVRLDGIARKAPARGTVVLSPFWRRRLVYVFEFAGDRGEPYRFEGVKHLRLARLPSTITTLPGRVLSGGKPIGEAVLRFSLRKHLRGLLGSIRIRTSTTAAASRPSTPSSPRREPVLETLARPGRL